MSEYYNKSVIERHWHRDTTVQSGNVTVSNGKVPQGVRVPRRSTVRYAQARVGTAPTGQALTGAIKNGSTTVGTWSIAAAATSAVVTLSSTAADLLLAEGDLLKFDVTQIGSGTAGADLSVYIEAE